METIFSRRNFVRSSALAAAASLVPAPSASASVETPVANDRASPVRLGLASYTFRNFTRSQLIDFMKQLNVSALNPKDAKDHCRSTRQRRRKHWLTMPPPASGSMLPG